MKGGTKTPFGYTIIEVMIFLAVSGFMFILAAAFISGRQARTEFRQGMNEVKSQVQDVINDVSNGYFPQSDSLACTGGGAAGPSFAGVGQTQGTHKGCVFMGKVIQFGRGGDPSRYDIYTVAANQYSSGSTLPVNFNQAAPKVVSGTQSLTDSGTLKWSLEEKSMASYGSNDATYTGAHTAIGAVGFFGSFGSYSTTGTLDSGAQTVLVVPIPASALGGSDAEGDINTYLKNQADTNTATRANVLICFDGGVNQKGSVTIGGTKGQRLATSMLIGGSTVPGCS